jgi:hypothetical protein
MTTVFKLRGNTGDEIVTIKYATFNDVMTLASSKRLSTSWEEFEVPVLTDTLYITFNNDKYIPGSYDRNVYLDVGSIKYTDNPTGTLNPTIEHADPDKHQHLLKNRPNTHTRGIFAWNGTYNVYILEPGDGGVPFSGNPPAFQEPGPEFNPEPLPVSIDPPGPQENNNMMIWVIIIAVILLCSAGVALMMVMM